MLIQTKWETHSYAKMTNAISILAPHSLCSLCWVPFNHCLQFTRLWFKWKCFVKPKKLTASFKSSNLSLRSNQLSKVQQFLFLKWNLTRKWIMLGLTMTWEKVERYQGPNPNWEGLRKSQQSLTTIQLLWRTKRIARIVKSSMSSNIAMLSVAGQVSKSRLGQLCRFKMSQLWTQIDQKGDVSAGIWLRSCASST